MKLEEIKKKFESSAMPVSAEWTERIRWLIAEVERLRETWQATRECVLRAEGRAEKAEAEVEIVKGWYNKAREETEREARYRGVAEADNRRLRERVRELADRLGLAQDLLYEFGRMDCTEGMDSNSYCGKCVFCRAHDLWEMIAAFLSEAGEEQVLQYKEKEE